MRSIKTFFISVLLLAPCLLSCGDNSSSINKDIEKYNSVVEYAYSSFNIKITTSKDDLSLESVYKIAKSNNIYTVNYSIQKYNQFDLDNGVIPDEMISTETGEYTTASVKYNISRFKFSENVFTSYSFDSNSFSGSINNAKQYLNVEYDCLNFKITCKYTDILREISMNYSLSDSTYCQIIINNFK